MTKAASPPCIAFCVTCRHLLHSLTAPEKLKDIHDLSTFDCGDDSINEYLAKKASKAQDSRFSTVFVTCLKGSKTVVGYYTLSSGMIIRANVVPKKAQRNSPDQHPITILGRMGVGKSAQGTGLSIDLLRDAIIRAIAASSEVGATALVVHPLNERLVRLYEKAGGHPQPTTFPNHDDASPHLIDQRQ